MELLLDRVEPREGGAVLRTSGVELAEMASRLNAGVLPAAIARELKLEPPDLLAALAALGLGADANAQGPSLVRRSPTRPDWQTAFEEPCLAELLPGSTRNARLALAAGLLQIHDFWHASHEAAQEADDRGETEFSAYWHGIAHRREPDPGNASYWFRRVGRHPIFRPLGQAAQDLVRAGNDPVPGAEELVRDGAWDPYAFIEFCRSVRAGSLAEGLARRLQRLEMAALIGPTAEAALGRA